MKKLNIFMGKDVFEEIEGDIISLDFFANYLIAANYKDFVCIGDFDGEGEIKELEKHCKVIKHPSMKDESDFELALMYAKENHYDLIRIYNLHAGNRIDHFLNNLRLIASYVNDFEIEIVDRHNYGLIINSNTVVKDLGYDYISFFPLDNISNLKLLDGFKYRYDDQASPLTSVLVSNEFISEYAKIELSNGNLFVLFSCD